VEVIDRLAAARTVGSTIMWQLAENKHYDYAGREGGRWTGRSTSTHLSPCQPLASRHGSKPNTTSTPAKHALCVIFLLRVAFCTAPVPVGGGHWPPLE